MFKNFYKNKKAGLTIIELMVVISIFMIITGITIFNYGKFNSSSSVQNLADDIALTVRRAQGYAIGVHGVGNSFDEGYGVRFTTNSIESGNSGSSSSFVLFADRNKNRVYNDNNYGICGTFTNGDECMEILNIKSADEIKEISLISGQYTQTPTSVDVTFKRPNPEPKFWANGVEQSITSLKIKISSSNNDGLDKYITISNNGQISVSNN